MSENITNLSTDSMDNSGTIAPPVPDLALPSSALPFGYIRCTCNRFPQIVYINQQMKDLLSISEDQREWTDFAKNNLYFMIPASEREAVREYLETVLRESRPIKVRHKLMKSDGEIIMAEGWIGIMQGPDGEKNYTLVYTEWEGMRNDIIIEQCPLYQSLEKAFDFVQTIDLMSNTAECIFCSEASNLSKLQGIKVSTEEFVRYWSEHYVIESDRMEFQNFFQDLLNNDKTTICFSLQNDRNERVAYLGILISENEFHLLFCGIRMTMEMFGRQNEHCMALSNLDAALNVYYKDLKHNYAALLFRRVSDHKIRIVFATDNLQRLLNFSGIQILEYMQMGVNNEVILKAAREFGVTGLEHLKANENAYYEDEITGERINVKCQHIVSDYYELIATKTDAGDSSGVGIPPQGIFVRTFGYFDIFADGTPVVFSNSKEKELLAILVDRNGGTLTSEEIFSILEEGAPYDDKAKNRIRKLAYGLNTTLKSYGIGHILKSNNGVRYIDTSAVLCDYYEFLSGNPLYRRAFHNRYMTNYAWAEDTLASLWDDAGD